MQFTAEVLRNTAGERGKRGGSPAPELHKHVALGRRFAPKTVTSLSFTAREPLEAEAGDMKAGENPVRVSSGRYVKVEEERSAVVWDSEGVTK